MQESLTIQYWMERIALFDDEHAFEKMFLHFYDGLYKLAFSFLKSKESSEEVVSDTFINIWRNRSRLLEVDNIKVYLYVSVKNLSIKTLSRSKNKDLLSLEDILANSDSAVSVTPEDLLVSKELISTLETAVNELPAKCKLIYQLVREHGLKYKEVAQLLNISVKTIDAQMAIAVKRIAQSIRLKFHK